MKKSSPPKLPDLRARARCGASGWAGLSSVSVHGTPGAMVSPMRSARTPRRDTTAPEVSPPATRMRLTPVSTSAAAMSASARSIMAPAASLPKRACVAATLSGEAVE